MKTNESDKRNNKSPEFNMKFPIHAFASQYQIVELNSIQKPIDIINNEIFSAKEIHVSKTE